jgi:hypothetical protein
LIRVIIFLIHLLFICFSLMCMSSSACSSRTSSSICTIRKLMKIRHTHLHNFVNVWIYQMFVPFPLSFSRVKKHGCRFLVRILEEQLAALSKAKYSTTAAASLLHGQDALDTTLGLLMNLGLDDGRASEVLSQGVLAPLAAILKTCPWDSSLARSASACARLLRFPSGAKQAREVGVLQGLLQVVKKAAGAAAATPPVSFPPAAGKSGAVASDAKAEMLDPCVRALAQALKNDEGSIKAVGEDITALLAVVSAVKCGREGTVGNAALALQMVANRSEYLEHLGQAGAVPALLNVVHYMRGPAQRNAALALARVVKREENMACLKALHGIDILNCYLKL